MFHTPAMLRQSGFVPLPQSKIFLMLFTLDHYGAFYVANITSSPAGTEDLVHPQSYCLVDLNQGAKYSFNLGLMQHSFYPTGYSAATWKYGHCFNHPFLLLWLPYSPTFLFSTCVTSCLWYPLWQHTCSNNFNSLSKCSESAIVWARYITTTVFRLDGGDRIVCYRKSGPY